MSRTNTEHEEVYSQNNQEPSELELDGGKAPIKDLVAQLPDQKPKQKPGLTLEESRARCAPPQPQPTIAEQAQELKELTAAREQAAKKKGNLDGAFSIFPRHDITVPVAKAVAAQLIAEVRSDAHKALCDSIRSAPDKDKRSALKARLPAVTASGVFSKRSATALVKHSGLLIADIDLDENPQLLEADQFEAVRVKLCADVRVHFLFTSPSGGLKVGFKIKATCPETHLAAFISVRDILLEDFGLVPDNACKDVSRLCYLSYDAEAHHNADAVEIETRAPVKETLPK